MELDVGPLESLESHANGSYEVVGVGPSTTDKASKEEGDEIKDILKRYKKAS
ncbi:unnamed protein product, partial [Citrullus colocynthis]